MIAELVGQKYRPGAGIGLWAFFTAGLMILGLKSYLIPDWKTLYIVCSMPYMIILSFWFFTPESMRWLHARGETSKAMDILKRIAKFNKKEIPEDVTLSPAVLVGHKKPSPVDVFRPRSRAVSSLIQGISF